MLCHDVTRFETKQQAVVCLRACRDEGSQPEATETNSSQIEGILEKAVNYIIWRSEGESWNKMVER